MTFKEAAAFMLNFGKHRGKTLDEVPLSYLDWLNGLEDLRPHVRAAVDVYLGDPAIQKALREELEA